MRNLFLFAITLLGLTAQSQKNTLLERSFWATNPSIAAIEAEIKKGNNPTQSNSNGFDPTTLAINEQASNEAVKFLLAIPGNDVNKITHDKRTYIFWAAYKGNIELMEYLISKGAKTNLFDDKGYSILNFAAATGQSNVKVYDLCISKGINPKKDLDREGANALLLIAPFDKDFTLINYFISKGLDIKSTDKNGNSVFNYAAKGGNIATLKKLIEKGVKFNDNALFMASQGGRGMAPNKLEVYQYLETLNINPNAINKNGENVLHSIVRKEQQGEIIKHFLSKGVDINKSDNDGNTPFINAASANTELDILSLLATNVNDINQRNSKGASALAFAVKSNSAEVVKFLLDKGMDASAVDTSGDNLAAYLIQSYNPQKFQVFQDKAKLLVNKGLDMKASQNNGNTVYHLAVGKNDVSLVKFISSSYKVDVNSQNNEGMTALHKAALIANDDSLLQYLISIGADKGVKTDFKETAFDLA
eukprot:Opistho-2@3620